MIFIRKIMLPFIAVLLASNLYAEKLKREDFIYGVYEGSVDSYYLKMIDIGHGTVLRNFIFIQSNGFGFMKMANLLLTVYNGSINKNKTFFENDLLDINFTDIDNDNYKEILITGTVNYSERFMEKVKFIYKYFPEEKKFRCIFRDAPFLLETGLTDTGTFLKFSDNDIREILKKKREEFRIAENFSGLPEEKNTGSFNGDGKGFILENLKNTVISATRDTQIICLLSLYDQVFFNEIKFPYIKKHKIYEVSFSRWWIFSFFIAENIVSGKSHVLCDSLEEFNAFIKNENLETHKMPDLNAYINDILFLTQKKYWDWKVVNSFHDIVFDNKKEKDWAFKDFGYLIKPLSIDRNDPFTNVTACILNHNILIEKQIKINNDGTVEIKDKRLGFVYSPSPEELAR